MDAASAYIVTYSIAYFVTGLSVKRPIKKFPTGRLTEPENTRDVASTIVMFLIGIGLLATVIYKIQILALALAILESASAGIQWWHVLVWNIPGVAGASPAHQVSMTATNIACAVCLLTLV